jgi:hypothetical protein
MSNDAESGWSREKATAERQDGISLRLAEEQGWIVHLPCHFRGDPVSRFMRVEGVGSAANHLEDAIMQVDRQWTPTGWTFDSGHWTRSQWQAKPEAGGWHLYRKVGGKWTLATTTEFRSADRARAWAEGRLDRLEGPLRGPKPRAGLRSTAKLPDVRVTEDERQEAIALVESLGLTYSQFVRAAIRFAQENIAGNKTVQIARMDNGKAHFVIDAVPSPIVDVPASDVDF